MKIASNRKAYHNYQVLKQYEAGISLNGPEIKSIRKGEVSIVDAYINIRQKQAMIVNMHINPYKYAADYIPIDPMRTRPLLLHKNEIIKLEYLMKTQQLLLIPLKIYFNKRSLVKISIGLCKSLKLHDKRNLLKEKADRQINKY